jgi:GH25 family lysozyme M1 (1,4-beta-N-acetylmuramidase)
MTKYGWDLSNHDWGRGRVNLADAHRAGISLVTHKATEGDWYKDPYLDDFASQLARTSFDVEGTYHVLNHGININRQTDFWISYVNSKWPAWKKHPCPIWQIDAEPLDGYKAPTKAEILACGARLRARLGISAAQIVVYGPKWVYGNDLRGIPYKLWASAYVSGAGNYKRLYPGDNSSFWLPYSGQVPAILQYSSSAIIGSQHTCDANAIRVSTTAQLQALFGHKTPAKPPIPPKPPVPPKPTPDEEKVFDMATMTEAELRALIHSEVRSVVWGDGTVPVNADPKNPTWSMGSALSYLVRHLSALEKRGSALPPKN